jgi:hypothetical protein
VSASKAQFGTVALPLNGVPLVPAPKNLEIYHMSSYLNGDLGPVAPSAAVQKLPARDVEVYLHQGTSVLQSKLKL